MPISPFSSSSPATHLVTGIRRQCLPAPIGCLASAWCRALEKAGAESYFGGSSSLLFNQPFGFGVGFCGFLSGFFSSELKNMSLFLPSLMAQKL